MDQNLQISLDETAEAEQAQVDELKRIEALVEQVNQTVQAIKARVDSLSTAKR